MSLHLQAAAIQQKVTDVAASALLHIHTKNFAPGVTNTRSSLATSTIPTQQDRPIGETTNNDDEVFSFLLLLQSLTFLLTVVHYSLSVYHWLHLLECNCESQPWFFQVTTELALSAGTTDLVLRSITVCLIVDLCRMDDVTVFILRLRRAEFQHIAILDWCTKPGAGYLACLTNITIDAILFHFGLAWSFKRSLWINVWYWLVDEWLQCEWDMLHQACK